MTVTAKELGLIGCRTCEKVHPMGTKRCGRCGGKLVSRDHRSLQKVWVWWIAGIMSYIPANIYPMLITTTFFRDQEETIIGGALELASYGAWGVAIIILVASVLIPLLKFSAIAYLAFSIKYGASISARRRYVMHEVVEFIGRWSMIDVFVVAILSSLVQVSVVASIDPGIAALAFALSVIFTMMAARSFDSRLIWDTMQKEKALPPGD